MLILGGMSNSRHQRRHQSDVEDIRKTRSNDISAAPDHDGAAYASQTQNRLGSSAGQASNPTDEALEFLRQSLPLEAGRPRPQTALNQGGAGDPLEPV